jgi:hypothetical protein
MKATSFDMAHFLNYYQLFVLIVFVSVLSQSKGHWLRTNALNFDICMSLKLRDDIEIANFFDNLMKKDANVVIELTCLTSNIRKEVCVGLDSFFFLSLKNIKKKPIICYLDVEPHA